jgi:DNA-binding NarL/FixJ family response regulator
VTTTIDSVPTHRVRIVLADDHQLFRDALKQLLDAEADFVVVGEAGDGEEAVAQTLQHEPDILLLDVAMPNANGMQVLEQIAAASRRRASSWSPARSRRSAAAGAASRRARVRAEGIRGDAAAREHPRRPRRRYFVGRECMDDLVSAVRSRGIAERKRRGRRRDFRLTLRERQIVSAVVDAYQNKEIAEKFAISEKTVKHHLTNIFNKVGVSNRLELALFAVHHHLDSSTL